MSSVLEERLRDWLPNQRWYAGGARQIHAVRVESSTDLDAPETAGLSLLILAVDHGDGVERYQLLLGVRAELPERLEHVRIGTDDDAVWYDAAHDAELTERLLVAIAGDLDSGPLRFRSVPSAQLDTEQPSLAIPQEQTNTSLVYGDEYILKMFRRLGAGANPDLEVTLALAQVGSEHIAEPLGWIETDLDGQPTTLALLQRFLRTGTDGWLLAAASVRDLYAEGDLHADEVGGDFAAESERLGAATASVHRDLARSLGTKKGTERDVTAAAAAMRRRLDDACNEVPSLATHADAIREVYDAMETRTQAFDTQRVHGDYHLGQVMRTAEGWVLLDFEGEPARPLAERRTMTSPLKDIAGMLRSFDYAAQHLLIEQYGDKQHDIRALEWSDRNQNAFCDGYAAEMGVDPREQGELLRAFELDKAVYEAMYESRHRPGWVSIPFGAMERILGALT
ncbi:MAG: maltokinase N-terminal cap-like domain-containing protein [Streptosporangiales bacterium]